MDAGSITNTARVLSDQTAAVVAQATVTGGLPSTDMLSPGSYASTGSGQPADRHAAWILWLVLSTVMILSVGWIVRAERFRRTD